MPSKFVITANTPADRPGIESMTPQQQQYTLAAPKFINNNNLSHIAALNMSYSKPTAQKHDIFSPLMHISHAISVKYHSIRNTQSNSPYTVLY